MILNAIKGAESDDNQQEDNVKETDTRYVVDNNRIVAVTYGDRNATGEKTAYKTFILNYNTYAVRVTYNNITYTIPSGGYVVVLYD